MVFSSVDLPAPLGPMIATISPSATVEIDALQDLVARAVAGDDARRRAAGAQPRRRAHVGLLHRRIGGELGERALGQVAALGHHDHRVAEPRDHVHVMLDQQEGHAVADAARAGASPISRGQRRVDAGDRLVEQDQLRLGHQRAADLQQLLLPAGERRGRVVGHAHEVQPPGDRRRRARSAPPRAAARRRVRAARARAARPAGARRRATGSRAPTGAGIRGRSGRCAPARRRVIAVGPPAGDVAAVEDDAAAHRAA